MLTSSIALGVSSKHLATLLVDLQSHIHPILRQTYASAYAQEECSTATLGVGLPSSVLLHQAVQHISQAFNQHSNYSSLLKKMIDQDFALQTTNTQAWETWGDHRQCKNPDMVQQCLWYSLAVDLEEDCSQGSKLSEADIVAKRLSFINPRRLPPAPFGEGYQPHGLCQELS